MTHFTAEAGEYTKTSLEHLTVEEGKETLTHTPNNGGTSVRQVQL